MIATVCIHSKNAGSAQGFMAALGFSLAQVQRHRIKSISFRDSLPSIAAGCVGYCLMLLVYRAGELTTVVVVSL